ncbi:ATP-binding cassette domain-containing protein [Halobaculum sp. WSA2]|uniref:ATP-binding cassette domain-containing protein n=1 Tax=Halobaculum saliterrae TaxID=2073113 RepID=A0A6B0SWB3_9EURY|nr:ABC transporter ATP-binding protein [Halobaculum saliterrae]MXR43338.1 ATP-binding cassette domain-containing protein [Halobaculum saliterrae]
MTPTPNGRTPDPSGTPALAVQGLSKRFGSGDDAVTAVDDVSFAIERGSVVGLLGPNGAGKTTLIKSILGTVIPDEGTVRVLGRDATDGRRAAYANVDAMLEGARNDYWRLTVRENLRYFATIGGIAPDSVADRHDRLLDRLDLADRADTPVRELSRGMKQKVSLASVLAGGAELVFLDEPTLGLDVEGSRTLRREIRRLAEEEDLTVVVSSHDMRVIEDVCDRVIVMSEGSIVADDAVERLLGTVDEYRVRVASDDLTPATVDDLRGRFDVADADSGADPPSLEVVTDGDAVYDLFDALRAAGVTLDRVETVEPTLEDVFVRLTGDRGATEPTPSAAGREPGGATNRPAAAVGDEGGAQ